MELEVQWQEHDLGADDRSYVGRRHAWRTVGVH
jgi:hypothetical protein